MYRVPGQQGSPSVLRYAVLMADGNYLAASDVSAVRLYVYNTDTGAETSPSGGLSLNLSTTVFSTPQPWEADDLGYNVRVIVPGALLPDVAVYRVEVNVAPSNSGYLPFALEHVEIATDKTYSAGGL